MTQLVSYSRRRVALSERKDDVGYYRRLAVAERNLAYAASNKSVAAVHAALAQKHEDAANAAARGDLPDS